MICSQRGEVQTGTGASVIGRAAKEGELGGPGLGVPLFSLLL